MKRRLRVLVLYGGKSAEHEVSVESARTVVGGLDPRRYEVAAARIDRSGSWRLAPPGSRSRGKGLDLDLSSRPRLGTQGSGGRGFEVVFPVLHGPFGEDGTVQGLLELAGLPYVGCGLLASAVGMDKELTKRLAREAGVLVPPDVIVRRGESLAPSARWRGAALKLGLPLFVKPAGLGSSVGVAKVSRPEELLPAVREAFRYDVKVMIEKGIEGPELACGVLGQDEEVETSVCGQILPKGHSFFSYRAKYLDPEGFELLIPAPIPARAAEAVRRSSARVFRAIEGSGLARVDYFLEAKTGKVFFGEVNTLPGFTSHSLYPKLWEVSGVPLPRLLDRLIRLALDRHRARRGLRAVPA